MRGAKGLRLLAATIARRHKRRALWKLAAHMVRLRRWDAQLWMPFPLDPPQGRQWQAAPALLRRLAFHGGQLPLGFSLQPAEHIDDTW